MDAEHADPAGRTGEGTGTSPGGLLPLLRNLVLLPFRLLWDLVVIVVTVWAFAAWWGFLLGSVIAFVLVLLFDPVLLVLPAFFLGLLADPWPDEGRR